MTDRLYRSPTDKVIAGVAGGMAVWLNIDPSLIRVAWVLLAIFSGGAFLLVYIVMMIVVPLPPAGWIPRPRDGWAPGTGAPGGWQPGGPAGPWSTPADGPAGAPGAPGTTPGAPGGAWQAPPAGWSAPPQGWSAPDGWAPRAAGNAGLILGGALVAVGAWFLIDDYVRIDWDLLWPVAVIVLGGVLIAGAVLRRGTAPPDAHGA